MAREVTREEIKHVKENWKDTQSFSKYNKKTIIYLHPETPLSRKRKYMAYEK